MSEKLINPTEFGLTENEAVIVEKEFTPVVVEREALATIYANIITQEITPELVKEAKELRLKLVKVRTSTDKIHKTQKAFYLAGGKFVDAWKNKNNTIVEQMESKLSEIENYYIEIERKRIEALKIERIEKLKEVCENTELYVVEAMSEEAFTKLINGLKLAKEAELKSIEDARIEAEKQRIEAERVEAERKEKERIENERIREENERLRLEAEEKEKAAKIEREKIEKEREEERKKQAKILKKQQEEAEKLRKIEADKQAKIQADLKAKMDAEKIEREKIEKELADKKATEEKAAKEKLQAEKKAALAPDKDKLKALALTFQNIQFPNLSNIEAVAILQNIETLRTKLVNYINEQSDKI